MAQQRLMVMQATQTQRKQELQFSANANMQSTDHPLQRNHSSTMLLPQWIMQSQSSTQHHHRHHPNHMHPHHHHHMQQQQQQWVQQSSFSPQSAAVSETSSTSLDSTAQTGHADGDDEQEEAYQKIKAMKEAYLPEVNEMYWEIAAELKQYDNIPQQPKSEQIDELKKLKTTLECIRSSLQVNKANIRPDFKENLSLYEKQLTNFMNANNRPRKQGNFHPPHPHPHPHPQQHPQPLIINQAQSQSHDHHNQMNPPQPNNMTNMQQSTHSSPMAEESENPAVPDQLTAVDGTHANANANDDLSVSSMPMPKPMPKPNINTEQPIERLIKMVESMSRVALAASVSDIFSVMRMTDMIAASAPGNGSKAALGRDLASITNTHLQLRLQRLQQQHQHQHQHGSRSNTSGTKRMKRSFNVVASNQQTGGHSDTSHLEESTTTSAIYHTTVKRPRTLT